MTSTLAVVRGYTGAGAGVGTLDASPVRRSIIGRNQVLNDAQKRWVRRRSVVYPGGLYHGCHVGKKVPITYDRHRQRRIFGNVVAISGDAGVFLDPGMRVLRNMAALQHSRRARISGASAAIEDFA